MYEVIFFQFLTLYFFHLQINSQAPPPYPQSVQNANTAKRFKADEVVQRPPQYLSQQQMQLLQHFQQNAANLTAQQQQMFVQLKQQYTLMVQHQRMVQAQQQQQQSQGTPGQPNRSTNFTGSFQPDGQRTPTSGTAAQTGFVQDGHFSPATGQTQQVAGMPYKSAATGYPQGQYGSEFTQISSTTANSDLGE